MKLIYPCLFLVFIITFSSCRDDFDTIASTGQLEFSKDTIFLDTIFTNIGSSTRQFKVYNRSNDDISIPTISLGKGETSKYRLNVDGLPGKTFSNVEILAKDSIFVFVETTIDITEVGNSEKSFLYTDIIQFDTGSKQQEVNLVTLVLDAIFLFPKQLSDGSKETINLGLNNQGEAITVEGFYLEDNELHFTNEKPYVIFGYAGVPANKTLIIDPGARIHFHANSGLFVSDQASIKANGEASSDSKLLENEIIFEGDRLEPGFSDIPGQWDAIWLAEGSTDNSFSFSTIKNATVGILVESNQDNNSPNLSIDNSQIYNSTNVGLLAINAFIEGENLVINNSGQASLAIELGGRYNFKHASFANYWNNSFRSFPAVLISNFLDLSESQRLTENLIANFSNSIIYGNERLELGLIQDPESDFTFNFKNTLIRFDDTQGNFTDDPLFDFSNTLLYQNILLNEMPNFSDFRKNQFQIINPTAANALADPTIAGQVPFDLAGKSRPSQDADAGAFESSDLE